MKMHGMVLYGKNAPKIYANRIPKFRDKCEIAANCPRILEY